MLQNVLSLIVVYSTRFLSCLLDSCWIGLGWLPLPLYTSLRSSLLPCPGKRTVMRLKMVDVCVMLGLFLLQIDTTNGERGWLRGLLSRL